MPVSAAVSKLVLIVDDDPDVAEVVALALKTAGYETCIAIDGYRAQELVTRHPPALIVLDLMMPGMSGFQFADWLKRAGLRPAVPILVLTAASQSGLKADWIEADAHLEKPFRIPALLDEVVRLSGAARLSAAKRATRA